MNKRTYRVKDGYRFGVGKALGPGDTIELTEAEAKGFLDKLELVKDARPAEVTVRTSFVVNPGGNIEYSENSAVVPPATAEDGADDDAKPEGVTKFKPMKVETGKGPNVKKA